MTSSLAGHMSHIHEDSDLTFSTIKKIFKKAVDGNLEGTEKLDGQNIFISYSALGNEARAVRNKSQIKFGGLDAYGLARQFSNLGSVQAAFKDSFKSFEGLIKGLPYETIISIFGPDANIFYNCEILDPRNANVILYDSPSLVVHKVGHVQVDKETGHVSKVDVSNKINILQKALEKTSNKQQFKIRVNSTVKLNAVDDKQVLNDAYRAIDKELALVGLGDNNTIGDYLEKRIAKPVELNVGSLPEFNKSLLIKRIIGAPGVSLTNIKKGLSREQKAILASFLPPGRLGKKKISALKKQAIGPVEKIIHKFVVKALQGMKSAFISDHEKEILRLRSTVKQAIDTIKSDLVKQYYPQAIDVLDMQVNRLGDGGADSIQTATEGFVFTVGDRVYKLTGNFAPVNQILGMLKYGRTDVAPIAKLTQVIDDITSGKRKNIYYMTAGGFKPPHRGHVDMIKKVTNKAKNDGANVTIFTGRNSRGNITLADSLQIMKILLDDQGIRLGSGAGEVNLLASAISNPSAKKYTDTPENRKANRVGKVVYTNTPTQPLVNLIESLPDHSVVFVFSSKDKDRWGMDIRKAVQNKRPDIEVFDYTVDTLTNNTNNNKLSATDMRKAIDDSNYELFKEYLPDESQHKASQIWSEILNKQTPSQNDESKKKRMDSKHNGVLKNMINERVKIIIKKLILGEDGLDEISSLAGGKVVGSVGGHIDPTKEENK